MRTEELEKIAALAVENLKDELTVSLEEAVNEAYRLGLNDGLAKEGTFEWALQQMRKGKTVERPGYSAVRLVGEFFESRCRVTLTSICREAVLATDWKIVTADHEGHDFAWALEQMRHGRLVKRSGWTAYGMGTGSTCGQLTAEAVQAKDWVLA